MESDFTYWRHTLPCGVKVEEIFGTAAGSQRVWRAMAMQIYCENGRDGFREVAHTPAGAPLLADSNARISITHTDGMLAVATLPPTPEADLTRFSPRAAVGIDAERADRSQVLRLRERFLSKAELALTAPEDLEANITAWTAKEALYKAALTPGLDFRTALRITTLPAPPEVPEGAAEIEFPDGTVAPMQLFSYQSEGCIITVAYSPKCSKFHTKA